MQYREDSSVTQYITFFNVFASAITYLAISIVVSFLRSPKYPTSVPWVGNGKGWIAALKNCLQGFSSSKKWVNEGYEKYSKHGKTFVLPATLGAPAETIIPRSQMNWMLEQPDAVLSTSEARYEILHGAYSFVTRDLVRYPYHERIVHKNLARNMNAIIPDMHEEVSAGVDLLCVGPNPEEFKKIDILEGFMMRLVPRITNRILVGQPLCRNQHFLDNMLSFAMDVIRGIMLFAVVPRLLHPIVGSIAALFPKYHYWQTRRWSLPLIKQRIADMRKKESGDPAYKSWQPPNDYITWSIQTATADNRPDELDPHMISRRIMPLNFASIHTTAITGHEALLDILSAPPSVLDSLREEASRILSEEGGKWTKAGLARMYKMDSAIRESQRKSVISLTFLQKMVMPKEGVVTPEGVHLEQGTMMSCPLMAVAEDGELHERPDVYDAFRYSRGREEYEALKGAEGKSGVGGEGLRIKQNGLVTTSDSHFAFGHGRHACPGRFLVSHELKMIFAHLFLNYDIKPIGERPKDFWMGRNPIPPQAFLEVRRRTG